MTKYEAIFPTSDSEVVAYREVNTGIVSLGRVWLPGYELKTFWSRRVKLGFLERPSRLAVVVDVNMDGMVKRKVGELQRESLEAHGEHQG